MLETLRDWAETHIADVSEKTEKTRKLVMFLGVAAIFISPDVVVTFGSASVAGLGISVSPVQKLPIAVVILAVLVFKIISLWVTIAIESGRDESTARRKAFSIIKPMLMEGEQNPDDIEHFVRSKAHEMTRKWTLRKLLWEVVMPSLVGIVGVTVFLAKALT